VRQHPSSVVQGVLEKVFTHRKDRDDVLILTIQRRAEVYIDQRQDLGAAAYPVIGNIHCQVLEAVGKAGIHEGGLTLIPYAQATWSARLSVPVGMHVPSVHIHMSDAHA
jgi:hypothetical protein